MHNLKERYNINISLKLTCECFITLGAHFIEKTKKNYNMYFVCFYISQKILHNNSCFL